MKADKFQQPGEASRSGEVHIHNRDPFCQPRLCQETGALGLDDRLVQSVTRLQVDRAGYVDYVRLKRVQPGCARHGDPVIPVRHEIHIADAVDLDRRCPFEALHCLFNADPAVDHRVVLGQEIAGEIVVASDRSDNLVQRDHLGIGKGHPLVALEN